MKFRMECLSAVFVVLVLATVFQHPGSGSRTGGGSVAAVSAYVNPGDVVAVTRTGGLPPANHFGTLLAGRDDAKIARVAGMVNRSAGRRSPTDLEIWSTMRGYPVDVVLKLRSGDTVYLQRVMDVTARKMATGEEFTGKISTDRFMMTIERGNDARHYILYSHEAPAYIEQGADTDMPGSSAF